MQNNNNTVKLRNWMKWEME